MVPFHVYSCVGIWLQWIDEALRELDIKCTLEPTRDGSGMGAAVIAAVSARL
jgi:hexokinase